MPMYDYKCEKCGKEVFDKLVSSSERDEQVCPECGEKMIRSVCSCKPTLIGVG